MKYDRNVFIMSVLDVWKLGSWRQCAYLSSKIKEDVKICVGSDKQMSEHSAMVQGSICKPLNLGYDFIRENSKTRTELVTFISFLLGFTWNGIARHTR